MNKKGFTIIELVVAIAVFAVLSIIALPSTQYIRDSNRQTKYLAYDKSITAAGKAFTEAYSNDLFGYGYGCAIISFDDLKGKELIEDIQLRSTSCSGKSTCIYVRKNKNATFNYETLTTCKESGNIVYGTGKFCDPNLCRLEDGSGPEVTLKVKGDKGEDYYYIDDNIEPSVVLTDLGVGLKANQTLNYTWVDTTANKTIATKVLEFNNEESVGSIEKKLDVPALNNIKTPTIYKLVVTGTVFDADNNKTDVNITKTFNYFIGQLYIYMNANGGTMASSNGGQYTLDGSGNVIYHPSPGVNQSIISSISYNGSLGSGGLIDYNDTRGLNIVKSGYTIERGKEWISTSGKVFNQETIYSASDFGISNSDLKTNNKAVTLKANWAGNKPTISISATNQTKEYDGTALVANSSCSRTSGTLNSGDSITCTCTGSQTAVGSSTKTLSSVVIKNSSGADVTSNYSINKYNGTLTVTSAYVPPAPPPAGGCNNTITGTLSAGESVNYAGKSWTVVSVSSSGVNLAFNGYIDNNGTEGGSTAGNYNGASTAVGKWINNNSTMKSALSNNCLINNGSNSNSKTNAPSTYYWLGSGSVYVPTQINKYSVSSEYFYYGYSMISSSPSNSEVRKSINSSSSSSVAYKAGSTASLGNGNSTITFSNDGISSSKTSDKYASNGFMFIDAVNGKKTGKPEYSKDNSSSRMITKIWKKLRSGSLDSGSPYVIENTETYKIKICGGSHHGEYYILTAKSETEYKHKSPTQSSYTTTGYSDNSKDYRFVFGGRGSGSGTSTRTFDLTSNCSTVTKYSTTTSSAKKVYYRPYVTVVR